MNSPASQMTEITNSESTSSDLFALTDEQILEIEPEAQDIAARTADRDLGADRDGRSGRRFTTGTPIASAQDHRSSKTGDAPEANGRASSASHQSSGADAQGSPATSHTARPEMPVPLEPPAWLAAQMKDPWGGEEAREFWNGVQLARQEAAAYRATFASPADARALKELYPGGVSEARTVAERARLLDDIDGAYFGVPGSSPEQTSAIRTQLAQKMMREDPAAFREMVFAGLRALEEGGKQGGVGVAASEPASGNVAQQKILSAVQTGQGSSTAAGKDDAPPPETTPESSAQVAAYAAFAKSANEDLERSVGAAITRTLEQALPNVVRMDGPGQGGAEHATSLRDRLGTAIRENVEKALQADRQLGEQVAQILSGGRGGEGGGRAARFDEQARAQVVRLIGERAQQLLPGAAKRVLSEWTQTTLASHRGRTQGADASASRTDFVAVEKGSRAPARRSGEVARNIGRNEQQRAGRVDYRKVSDEQILDM